MTGRLGARLLLAVLTMLDPVAGHASEEDGASWRFRVLLDERDIGYHDFRLYDDGDASRLETAASFEVKLLFITAFRYRHENTETWRDGCLSSIDAVTNRNGDRLYVNGRRNNDGFRIATGAGEEALSGCVQSFAYWNPQILAAERLLNSQTGEYEDVEITFEGGDAVVVGDGTVPALRYRIGTKSGDITLWYAKQDRRWLALEAPARGDRRLRYEPVRLPEPAAFAQLAAIAGATSRS